MRHAQNEFQKFDMDDNGNTVHTLSRVNYYNGFSLSAVSSHKGWISRAVLLPVMRACLSHVMSDRDLKVLFTSQSLKSMVSCTVEVESTRCCVEYITA